MKIQKRVKIVDLIKKEKKWKMLQEFVKNLEKTAPYVNISVATLIINPNRDYSDVIFNKKKR